MQVPRSSSANTMLILGIALVLLIMLAFILFYRNSGQPVYLKPKENNETKGNNTDDSQNTTSSNENVAATPTPSHSMINQDESVMLSEMKALRQSAVSLSASQKEGATQIIRDCMSDGNTENSSNNENKE